MNIVKSKLTKNAQSLIPKALKEFKDNRTKFTFLGKIDYKLMRKNGDLYSTWFLDGEKVNYGEVCYGEGKARLWLMEIFDPYEDDSHGMKTQKLVAEDGSTISLQRKY